MWSYKRKPIEKKLADNLFPDWPTKEVYSEISQLHENDAELRVWLPETCFIALKAVAEESDLSLSDFAREFLVVFLYGELTLRRMHAEKAGIYYMPPPPPLTDEERDEYFMSMPRFSRARKIETVPGLGKNMSPMKVFVPAKLKHDCEKAAVISKTPLSRLVREALIARLLGHRILLARYGEWSAAELNAAADWESGRTEPEVIYANEPVPEGNTVVID